MLPPRFFWRHDYPAFKRSGLSGIRYCGLFRNGSAACAAFQMAGSPHAFQANPHYRQDRRCHMFASAQTTCQLIPACAEMTDFVS